MKYLLSFYVGTERDKYNERMDPGFVTLGMQDVRELLLKRYDGYTEINTSGGYLNNSGTAIVEDGAKFEVLMEYTNDPGVAAMAQATATDIALLLNQASVMYAITPVMLYSSAP